MRPLLLGLLFVLGWGAFGLRWLDPTERLADRDTEVQTMDGGTGFPPPK
jgi:hypothetical protein